MNFDTKQLTEQQAIDIYESGVWKEWSLEKRAKFQMSQKCLMMPFGKFHEAVEKTLGRPVWTHEFALSYGGIKAELFDGAEPPTMQEIIELIPEEKRIIIKS